MCRVNYRLQSPVTVLFAGVALEALAVHADVPVGQVVDESHQTRHDRVQPVRSHLLLHEEQQRLRERQDPAIHHVRRAIRQLFACSADERNTVLL